MSEETRRIDFAYFGSDDCGLTWYLRWRFDGGASEQQMFSTHEEAQSKYNELARMYGGCNFPEPQCPPRHFTITDTAHGQTITQGEPPRWTTAQVTAIFAFAVFIAEEYAIDRAPTEWLARFLAVPPAENAREGEEKPR